MIGAGCLNDNRGTIIITRAAKFSAALFMYIILNGIMLLGVLIYYYSVIDNHIKSKEVSPNDK